jgi:hypothetical protein
MRKWTEGRKLGEWSIPAVVIDNVSPPSRLSAIVQKHAAELRPRRKKMTLPTVVKAMVAAEAEGSFETDQLDRQPDTDVLECYFVGGHSDVGGGSVSNATQHSLSQITLR